MGGVLEGVLHIIPGKFERVYPFGPQFPELLCGTGCADHAPARGPEQSGESAGRIPMAKGKQRVHAVQFGAFARATQ